MNYGVKRRLAMTIDRDFILSCLSGLLGIIILIGLYVWWCIKNNWGDKV